MLAAMEHLKVPRELAQRYLNDGFSGGEKKRVEILQMAMLKPRIAVLDETDSGLDIDALKVVANGVQQLVGPDMGALVITHYQRILNYIKPDFVHVFVGGKIVQLELLNPKFAILDETDSGLDIDALRIVSEGVNRFAGQGDKGVLLITHYTRILRYIKPDFVHVFVDGQVVEEGGPELADRLEEEGYDRYATGAGAATIAAASAAAQA